MRALATRPDLAEAFALVDQRRAETVALWKEINDIPAPSGHEAARAERVVEIVRSYGVTEVERDAAGNVIVTLRGTGGGSRVVFDAHLDTVFPLSTPLATRVEGAKIHGPGIGDNARNVIALLEMIRVMRAANVQTRGDVVFAFTVEEETSFRGVNQIIADRGAAIDRYVTLDGGFDGFTYAAIGIYWDRYHFRGPGGHTRSPTPPYSATAAVASSINRLYGLELPPQTNLNVAMLGAADAFNVKATDAWFSVDLRSNDQRVLDRFDREVERIVEEEARRYGLTVRRERESRRAVASIPGHRQSEMVKSVEAVFRAFGMNGEISDAASNHTSAALAAGIPAIGTGTAPCARSHSTDEWCEVEPLFAGIKRNVALAVALAALPPRRE